ncbi:MAG: lycopene cyclase family protein [Chitinophagaceae bacterium]|nr:lycopene cyclase family protein [Chitinophagaceae bacterium]
MTSGHNNLSSGNRGYDYIITGAGCAGLSLVTRMIHSGKFADKKILLLDKSPKTANDRTWCFWETGNGFFEDIVHHQWPALYFKTNIYSALMDVSPYRYKMIRGIDFYNYCFNIIRQQPNVDVRYGEVNFSYETGKAVLYCNGEKQDTEGAVIFNSVHSPGQKQNGKFYLQQHFKGWVIETPAPVFNTNEATLMDFRVHQDYGTTFVYVLPLSETKALVEYTLFSEKLLEGNLYNKELETYIDGFLGLKQYRVIDEEFGIIPMTNAHFDFYHNGMYNIGTAGGQTKASSGYTFQFIQKQTSQIVQCLADGRPLFSLPPAAKRFHFYDSILLRLLKEKKLEGREIFSRLFSRNKPQQIFKFLDNETTITEELQLISTLQFLPFLKAGLKELL